MWQTVDTRSFQGHLSDVKQRLARTIARAMWRTGQSLSVRQTIADVPIWLMLSRTEADSVTPKLTCALDLIVTYDARLHHRLRSLAAGIIVIENPETLGSWFPVPRLVALSLHHLLDVEETPEHIAATIAHETTHAWLDVLGYRYDPDRRHRIEAICNRAEARMARRMPGCAALSDYYEVMAERTLAKGPGPWNQEARIERDLKAMQQLGVPGWIRGLARMIRRSGRA